MPKIFLTGSNDSRGFVTGSGYINNPARVLTRERDNQKTNYPTVKRLGDASRKGDESLSVFDDNFSIAYADKLSDEFNFSNYNEKTIFLKNVNSSLWEVSNTEKVRRDVTLSGTNDFPGEGSFVFEGVGSSGKRWIKTKSKIKNPTVSIDIYQGPYDINLGGLNLNQGSPTDILKIQTSIDGSTWEDVFINSYNVNNEYFLDIAGGYLKPFIDFSNAVLQGNQNNPGLIGISQTTPKSRPMCNVSLSMREFSNHGNQPFYLRIVQDAISDSNKRTWAIGKINIISRNKSVTYPVLLSQTIDHERRILSQSIASPNKLSNLTVDAASISGISNDLLPKRQEILSPYTDKTRNLQGQSFYDQGVDPKILPGFSSPVLSKTKFEIDLSPSSPTEFGYVTNIGSNFLNSLLGDQGQQLMVYWNSNLKKWEKIGQPLTFGNGASTPDELITQITESCLGFSPERQIGYYDQSSNILTLEDKDSLGMSCKPTETFAFPFGAQYYATSSQYVLAKDIGITKPFLLEKCEISADFNMFEYDADYGGPNKTSRGRLLVESDALGNDILFSLANYHHVKPTFFMLRQHKYNFSKEINFRQSDNLLDPSIVSDNKYTTFLPRLQRLVSGSNSLTFVDESRDLLAYGQFSYILSTSFDSSGWDWSNGGGFLSPVDLDSLYENKFLGEKYILNQQQKSYSDNPSNMQNEYTGSIQYSFNVNNFGKYNDIGVFKFTSIKTGDVVPTYFSKNSTRSNHDMKSDRSIINGNISLTKNNKVIKQYSFDEIYGQYYRNVEGVKLDSIERHSPYLILPEDKLIFGWQYPARNAAMYTVGSSNYNVNGSTPWSTIDRTESMTLFGKSKLTLYGSQIQNEVEFHDGLNQQLNTNVAYEIIGSEPVVDQFQISTRQELTGSLFASLTFANVWQDPVLSFGTGIFNKKYFNYTEPFRRINLRVYDTISGELYNSIKPLNPQFIELFWKNQFNTNLFDMSRDYIDSLYSSGKYLKNSLYGTIESLTVAGSNEGGYQLTKSGNLTKITLNPMYVFNNSHFGYYSDMITQGKDSRFIDDPTTSQDDIVTQSPIKIQFVKSEYDDTGLDVRTFFAISPSDINNTAEITYQSSNLSLYATSSLPFFDDGVVKNRSYIENEVIIS